jgi:hypothetical protein
LQDPPGFPIGPFLKTQPETAFQKCQNTLHRRSTLPFVLVACNS